uniref:Uncharacterized protein n=1 Tax=Oryza sativa subsp. japonica TaxID=39947 RepID=Q6YX56_ORYSJ|nr:hypothetical protein [Oryza sativa Japonica Group]
MESAAARKPARPKRRQAVEKARVERRPQNMARRKVVAEEKTFSELGMASANSPAAAAGWASAGRRPTTAWGKRGASGRWTDEGDERG